MKYMSKKKATKKRNKPYQGSDAAASRPTVHRYTAEKRGPVKEWWHEKKRPAKISGIILAVLLFIVFIVTELVSLVTNGV